MAKIAFFVLILSFVVSLSAQSLGSDKQVTPVTSNTLIQGWQTGDTLTSLIRAGFTNHIALSIVLRGDSLCRNILPGTSENTSIRSLIEQVERRNPNYIGEVRNNVLYVHPISMKASTVNALELRIPRFTSEATNLQDNGISLWMYIRGVLVPQEASMFSGGMQKNAESLPAFSVSDASVHDILDHLITMGQGGVWIMHDIPSDWQVNPTTKPYDIFSYSGDQESAHLIKCQEADRAPK